MNKTLQRISQRILTCKLTATTETAYKMVC